MSVVFEPGSGSASVEEQGLLDPKTTILHGSMNGAVESHIDIIKISPTCWSI